MPVIGTIVTIIIAIVGIALQAQAASDAKSAAKKRAGIEQQRVDIARLEAETRRQNEIAALRRQARLKQAAVLNQAAAQNVRFTTPTSGALGAVRANLKREIAFSDQTAALAARGDAITLTQIAFERSATISRANAALFSGIVSSIGSIGSAVSAKGAFNLGALKTG